MLKDTTRIRSQEFAPLSAENPQKWRSIITVASVLTVSLYECRHTPLQILLGFLRNPRTQNLQGNDFCSGKWDFPPQKTPRRRQSDLLAFQASNLPAVHAAGLD